MGFFFYYCTRCISIICAIELIKRCARQGGDDGERARSTTARLASTVGISIKQCLIGFEMMQFLFLFSSTVLEAVEVLYVARTG